MRKIPTSLENPIDNFFINLAEITSPYYKNLNFTPNMLTSLSLIFGIMSAVFFYYECYKFSALLFLISYYYDCTDGFYARKYDMVSDVGDVYDHVSDVFKVALILGLMFYKAKTRTIYIILLLIFINFLLMSVHLGCQEIYYGVDVPTLNYLKNLCPADAETAMNITRFFGNGTFTLIMTYFIYTFGNYTK